MSLASLTISRACQGAAPAATMSFTSVVASLDPDGLGFGIFKLFIITAVIVDDCRLLKHRRLRRYWFGRSARCTLRRCFAKKRFGTGRIETSAN